MRDKITLTGFYPEDADTIIAAMNSSEVARWLSSVPQPYGLNEAAAFIAEAGADEFAIRVNGRLAGTLRVGTSLGIWIAPEFQGRGIGLRASVIGLSRYFMDKSQQGIDAVYLDGNHASANMLAKLGFRKVAPVTAWSRAQAKELSAMSLYLSRTDFAAHQGICIDTPRLRISPFAPDDLADLHRIATLPSVARMLQRYFPDMTPEEVAEGFIGDGLTPPIRLVIRHEGRVAGSVGLLSGSPHSIAYFLDPALTGQGVTQEAVAAFIADITERFGLTELQAGVFDDNSASVKILQKLGFQRIKDISSVSKGRDKAAPAGLFFWRDGASAADSVAT